LRPLVGALGVDSNTQQDAQEFLLKIFELLDEESRLDQESPTNIFRGQTVQCISCSHVNFKKERYEHFYDLSVDIDKAENLVEALDRLFEPCDLSGSNQYRTPDNGLQDALKSQYISKLPNVLFVHLKRFSYDPDSDTMVKLPNRVMFPEHLNMAKYLGNDEVISDDSMCDRDVNFRSCASEYDLGKPCHPPLIRLNK
jgi:ubiquitin carboxyl-terminal hydrolase 34